MTAPEPVVLTDEERRELTAIIETEPWHKKAPFVLLAVDDIIADRLAAERAAHEALRERLLALHPETEHGCPGESEVYIGIRNTPDGPEEFSEWSCPTREAALAATAPTPPQDGTATEGERPTANGHTWPCTLFYSAAHDAPHVYPRCTCDTATEGGR